MKLKGANSNVDFARGDLWLYFALHNIISVGIFYFLTIRYAIGPYFNLFDILTTDFLSNFGLVLMFSLFAAVSGRVVAFLLLKFVIFKYVVKDTQVRRWRDLNVKINKMDGAWLIAMVFSAIAFMIGATILIHYVFFSNYENDVLTLMLSYAIVKIVIVIYVRNKT